MSGFEVFTQYHPLLLEYIAELIYRVKNRHILYADYWDQRISGSYHLLSTGPLLSTVMLDRSRMTPMYENRFLHSPVSISNDIAIRDLNVIM